MQDSRLKEILEETKVIAVVGCSNNAEKEAHKVPAYLQEKGYYIVPVNPNHPKILGEVSFKNLQEIDTMVDMVLIFRPSEDVTEVVKDVLKMKYKPKVVWMQLGIQNAEAAKAAEHRGIDVVQDKCMRIELERLL